jgi:hypothetical protein
MVIRPLLEPEQALLFSYSLDYFTAQALYAPIGLSE